MSKDTDAPWKDESLLREKYCVEGLTMSDIAEEWDTTFDTIRYYKDKFELESSWGIPKEAREQTAEDFRREYWDRGKSLNEIAEELDVSQVYVLRRMDELGVERRVADHELDGEWKDADTLERLYWDEEMTLEEIGEQLGCSATIVSRWMQRFEIDRDPIPEEMPPCHRFDESGYEIIKTKIDQVTHTVGVHRLIAIGHGELDPSDVRNDRIHVHHKNGVRWDNRPENLEVMSKSEHHTIHAKERVHGEDGEFIG